MEGKGRGVEEYCPRRKNPWSGKRREWVRKKGASGVGKERMNNNYADTKSIVHATTFCI